MALGPSSEGTIIFFEFVQTWNLSNVLQNVQTIERKSYIIQLLLTIFLFGCV